MACPGCRGGAFCYCEMTDMDPDNTECVFGDECCMPGLHLSSECHTAEMIAQFFEDCQEEYERQQDGTNSH